VAPLAAIRHLRAARKTVAPLFAGWVVAANDASSTEVGLCSWPLRRRDPDVLDSLIVVDALVPAGEPARRWSTLPLSRSGRPPVGTTRAFRVAPVGPARRVGSLPLGARSSSRRSRAQECPDRSVASARARRPPASASAGTSTAGL
jgi:hypothetical protein